MTVDTTATGADGAQDRRRAREDRGLKPAGAAARTDRLPPAPRERRPLLAAFAVLLIVGGAAAAGLLALRADERVPVLVAVKDIAVGQEITKDAVGTTPVASEGLKLIPSSQEDLVVGQFARVGVTEGQLIDTTMLTKTSTLTAGKVAVGATIAAGHAPATGLLEGDVVQLVQVSDGQGTVIVPDAFVSMGEVPEKGSTKDVKATFIVDESDGARIAAIAADDALSVVLVSRGSAVDTGKG
ncbi:SAF domain-containing protein [Cellulomonas sp. URHE0023]|uniref:SAF domain-containing protein n=1 Tax=Cellulomonas sp. URHE0023 TaxID=1380354 RepID=UPI00068C0986|nr:SAF domain-containing protein [Cellulomonas sp. URHE0023]